MKKRGFLKRINFVKITTIGITLFIVINLTSSSLISTTLNNIPKKQFSNLEEKEHSIGYETSAGLAPNIAVDNHDIPLVSLPFDEYMWGYIVNSSVYDEGTCTFVVDDPGDIEYLQDTESEDFLSGGTGTTDEYWLAVEYGNGALWGIDWETGDMTYIGGGGASLNGLAWDPVYNLMFGASGSKLYMVDPETGEQEEIGSFGNDVNEMIGIAVNTEGVIYGWDLGDKLWQIDMETGEATEVGPLGIDLNYAQDGDFCHETGYLYLTAYTVSPNIGSYLYKCNVETVYCELIGQFEGNSQITASVKSFGIPPLPTDIGIKNIISPNDGDAGENMEVIVQVKNYGYQSEDDVPVNVVILKDGIDEEYNETKYIDINYGETIDVEMPSWTPDDWHIESNEYIDYKITACVNVYNDANETNDYKEKWFELYFPYLHDVGCTDVREPKSGPAQAFPINATIKNFGQYDECCFKTYVEIEEVDLESKVELLTEDFSNSTFPPDGWKRTHDNWNFSDSNKAGGFSGEARFYYLPVSNDLFRLYTSAIDTSDYDIFEIEFKQFVNHYSGPYILQIEISNDGVNWDVVWDISPNGNIGPETVTILIGQNVGSTTYVSWTFNGDSWNINNWYVDDIVVNGYNFFDPEYEDYHCIGTIEPGEELYLEFDDWTPDFLSEETSGTKKYLLKAWTDMYDPSDENLYNDFFANFIKLDFFHDVGIKEIISPPQNGSGKYRNCWYAFDCSYNCFVRWCESGVEIISCPGGVAQGGTFVEDEWWICDSTGSIWIIDTETGDGTYVGSSGLGELVALAYHEKSKTLYGMSTSTLYKIDMDTGHASLIGSFSTDTLMISSDCDRNGTMYAYDLGFGIAKTYTVDLDTGHATIVGPTGVYLNYGQDMAYDYDNGIMYTCAFNYNTFQGELHRIDLETGEFTYVSNLPGGHQITCFAIPYTIPLSAERYVPLGAHDINVIVENIGTFPELDLTCFAKIYEYITNCTNGTLVYEDNIADINLDEPLEGNETLNFDSYNFSTEGLYGLSLNITDDHDDYPNNNNVVLGIGADGTPPVSNHTLDPETPDGENGWYISELEITICAEDPGIGCGHPGSGVKEIRVSINGGSWQAYEGECLTIIINKDYDDILFEYYAIDNVGNSETIKSLNIKRDQTKPDIKVEWETYKISFNWYVKFTCKATDAISGMDKIEMYIDDELKEAISDPGPTYEFVIKWSNELDTSNFKFKAIDKAGNSEFDSLNGSQIHSYTISKSISQQSYISNKQKSINFFPANRNIIDDSTYYSCATEAVEYYRSLISGRQVAYTIIGTYPNCSSIFEFKLNDLENLTCICEDIASSGSIAWVSSGIIIFSDIYGNLYKINLETCEYTYLGSSGTGEIVSLAYDPSNETLFGISTSSLYKIDIDTVNTTLLGHFGIGDLMISCDCDRFGNLYGINLGFGTCSLYSIDKNTGKATIIGPIGITLTYSTGLAYDKDFDVLYLFYKNHEYVYVLEPIIGNGYNGTFKVDQDIIDLTITFTKQTKPPNAPHITGPTSGKMGMEYEYNFSLSDPDNNPMYLRVDWGNGTPEPWQGLYNSGTTFKLNHTWNQKGTFNIRAQAKDIYGADSNWTYYEVTLPKNKQTNFNWCRMRLFVNFSSLPKLSLD